MSFALPVKRLRETDTLLAFYHPRPFYPFHILIVPKKAIPALQNLIPEDGGLLIEILQCAQSLVEEFGLERSGCRLVINGGGYQQVPQLHFHLIFEGDAAIARSGRIADRD